MLDTGTEGEERREELKGREYLRKGREGQAGNDLLQR